MTGFRKGVVGVFRNKDNLILFCERADRRGSWQLPQGGLEPGESPEQAFQREMQEELGTNRFNIISKAPNTTRYEFPASVAGKAFKNYRGQEHHWFLATFIDGTLPDLAASDGEFVSWQWLTAAEGLSLTIDWKQVAYREGLAQFHLV